jgi:MFS family permease
VTSTETVAPEKTKAPLGSRYWRLWTASVISNLGDGVALIAFPWLASAVTRNAFLIALIGVMNRLPWLVFTLPAGVLTDRLDRRKIMVWSDVARTGFTALIGVVVVANEAGLPDPGSLGSGASVETNVAVYLILLISVLALGFAEVLRDNAAQTFLPAIVKAEQLERANGNLWGAESVANQFAGPPLGSLLLAAGFSVPFFFDAGTFAVAAGLVFLISGQFRAKGTGTAVASKRIDWKGEMKEGFLWLWRHPLLRPMAIVLGFLNGLGMAMFATYVLFAQENLDLETGLLTGVLGSVADTLGFESVGTFVFALLMMGGALGAVLGSLLAPRISKAIGSGPSLYLTMIGQIVVVLVIGVTTRWWVAFLAEVMFSITAILWNIITVSLRQTIIPDHLLGRVNSVYRFFGWGMMPIGAATGGLVVTIAEQFTDRGTALRIPFFFIAVASVLLLLYAAPRLTTEKMESARSEAIARRDAEEAEVELGDAEAARDALSEMGAAHLPPDDLDEPS